jgi:hypothetical protein
MLIKDKFEIPQDQLEKFKIIEEVGFSEVNSPFLKHCGTHISPYSDSLHYEEMRSFGSSIALNRCKSQEEVMSRKIQDFKWGMYYLCRRITTYISRLVYGFGYTGIEYHFFPASPPEKRYKHYDKVKAKLIRYDNGMYVTVSENQNKWDTQLELMARIGVAPQLQYRWKPDEFWMCRK